MAEFLSSVSTAWTFATRLREISKNIENAEFENALANLMSEMSQAKIEAAEAKERIATLLLENRELKDTIERLNSAESDKPTVVNGLYQWPNDEGYYCTACWDSKDKRVLTNEPAIMRDAIFRMCPVCKAIYSK